VRDLICGTATVGERGQIVIPVDVRRKFNINAGDKICVLVYPSANGILLLRLSDLNELFSDFLTNLRMNRPDDTGTESNHKTS
jgi:AbrB family looped-hinge helix DNA binding protein